MPGKSQKQTYTMPDGEKYIMVIVDGDNGKRKGSKRLPFGAAKQQIKDAVREIKDRPEPSTATIVVEDIEEEA